MVTKKIEKGHQKEKMSPTNVHAGATKVWIDLNNSDFLAIQCRATLGTMGLEPKCWKKEEERTEDPEPALPPPMRT